MPTDPTTTAFDELAYLRSLRPGERVIETGQSGIRGWTGTVYEMSADETGESRGVGVRWDAENGGTPPGVMCTSVTHGTRRIRDVLDTWASPDEVAALRSRVAKLSAHGAELAERYTNACTSLGGARHERDAAQAEVAALKARVAELEGERDMAWASHDHAAKDRGPLIVARQERDAERQRAEAAEGRATQVGEDAAEAVADAIEAAGHGSLPQARAALAVLRKRGMLRDGPPKPKRRKPAAATP